MDELTLIETIQSYIDVNVSAAVRTSGGTDDERPIPSVVLDETDVVEVTHHNTNLAQVVEDDTTGQPDERYYRFYYEIRLDYLLTHKSDHEVQSLFQDMQTIFRPLTENPRRLDGDIHRVRIRGGGGFNGTFVEDPESQMTYAILVKSFHQMDNIESDMFDDSTLDTIENVIDPGQDFNVT